MHEGVWEVQQGSGGCTRCMGSAMRLKDMQGYERHNKTWGRCTGVCKIGMGKGAQGRCSKAWEGCVGVHEQLVHCEHRGAKGGCAGGAI